MRWRPRLVALDIDGTLPAWTEGEEAAPEPAGSKILKALRAALDAGAEVVLCSGRSPLGMTRVADRLGLYGQRGDRLWMVASNGAVLCRYAPLETVRQETFDPAPAVRAFLARRPSALVAVEYESGYRVTAPFPAGELPGETVLAPLADLLARPAGRVIVRDPAATPEEFARLAGEVDLRGTAHTVGWSAWLDLTPLDVSKASGLRQVRAGLGLADADVLAIGDGCNDIEMLREAGRGVAVAQAPQDVRDAADAVTAAAEDDGVALELERWFG
ncbi:HAD family hydrolase [Streptomyces sp. NPDC050617]|uniref:HAD family hydrolase n=1 Tax=Streptomyces sp. NPDC050617 TaxID=3154628 RepID=UPI00341FFB31